MQEWSKNSNLSVEHVQTPRSESFGDLDFLLYFLFTLFIHFLSWSSSTSSISSWLLLQSLLSDIHDIILFPRRDFYAQITTRSPPRVKIRSDARRPITKIQNVILRIVSITVYVECNSTHWQWLTPHKEFARSTKQQLPDTVIVAVNVAHITAQCFFQSCEYSVQPKISFL